MPIATVIALLFQYGPLAAKIVSTLIEDAPQAQKLITDLAQKFEASGSSPVDAIAKAFSMHITPPSQWTAEEYKTWYSQADGAA